MKLSMMINYVGDFPASAQQVVELEKVGLDIVWVAEAYSFDSISQLGYLAAVTNKVQIGTGIVNVYSRTAALMAMTAAGCDYLSDGRFILGLGAYLRFARRPFHPGNYLLLLLTYPLLLGVGIAAQFGLLTSRAIAEARAADDVLELAHVARESVRSQQTKRIVGD